GIAIGLRARGDLLLCRRALVRSEETRSVLGRFELQRVAVDYEFHKAHSPVNLHGLSAHFRTSATTQVRGSYLFGKPTPRVVASRGGPEGVLGDFGGGFRSLRKWRARDQGGLLVARV